MIIIDVDRILADALATGKSRRYLPACYAGLFFKIELFLHKIYQCPTRLAFALIGPLVIATPHQEIPLIINAIKPLIMSVKMML